MKEQDKAFWDSEEAVFERAKGNPFIIDPELLGKVTNKKEEVIMQKSSSEELRELEVELAKILCKSPISIGEKVTDPFETYLVKFKLQQLEELHKNPVVAKAIQLGFDHLTGKHPVKKTSAKWLEETKLKIIDADGWDRSNFEYSFYHEEITKEEFERRVMFSTISIIDEFNKESESSKQISLGIEKPTVVEPSDIENVNPLYHPDQEDKIFFKLPSERIRELCQKPGVYTVDGIIKYLDQEFMDRLKPFVLRSEMESKISVMQLIIEETEAKLSKCEKLLKDMEFAYTNKDADFPHGFETETLKDFDLYFGKDPEARSKNG